MNRISYSLPNPDRHKDAVSSRMANQIIFASSAHKYHYPAHRTPYVFLANFRNPGSYFLNSKPITADERFFYFLNPGDELEIHFRNNNPLETLLILFSEEFLRSVAGYKLSAADRLLDSPNPDPAPGFNIAAIPFFYNPRVRSILVQIIRSGGSNSGHPDCETLLADLISEALFMNDQAAGELEKIEVKKKNTREELYKRVTIARVFMEDNTDLPLSIEEIARTACLNKFHFLKVFKSLYGITPHQFLIGKKLEKAFTLLQSDHFSIGEVCQMVGFESLGSFSNLFKRRYGYSPSKITNFE